MRLERFSGCAAGRRLRGSCGGPGLPRVLSISRAELRVLIRRFACLLVVGTASCYRYAPIQGAVGDEGKPVRVRLTDQGSINLAPLIGPTIVTVDGTIVSVRDTIVALSLTNAIARSGVETPWRGERVDVPRSAISDVQLRELDRRRSWLAALGGVAATAAVGAAWNLLGGSSGGKIPPQNGGPR